MLGKEFQAKVKSASGVLVGVAQIRIGKPSIRGIETAIAGAFTKVPQSTTKTVDLPSGGTCKVVVPGSAASTGVATVAVSGTYDGDFDGAFIFRYNGTNYDVYGPDGIEDAGVTAAEITSGYAPNVGGSASGITVTGSIAGAVAGDTWIVPVWAGSARNATQTGIICPYSLFKAANESVGGLDSSSFDPKIEEMKTLESGFPSSVDDRIITKTSVDVKFDAKEYTNSRIKYLRTMLDQIMNKYENPAVACEVVCGTRGGSMISFWIPNSSLKDLPSIAPTNDYSKLTWSLGGSTQTEDATGTETYNAWLAATQLYYELEYTH